MRVLSIILIIEFYFGCSDVKFKKDPGFDPVCQNFNQTCVKQDEVDYFDYSITIGDGAVDLIFIDDNSGSMSTEQKNMGEHFPSFLDSLEDLDYHIGMITPDISSTSNPKRAANLNGALQDGSFIQFTDGSYFLSRSTSQVETVFLNTIKRQETINCENELQDAKNEGRQPDPYLCPSMDERGIYAANLAIDKAPAGFFRSFAHLALVILSDEDERSKGGTISGYALEDKDKPQILVDKVRSLFGTSKSFSVHAVVIKPGDSSCLTAQNSQSYGVKGFEGKIYSDLVNLTSGVLGSVCASDWGAQMGEIGYGVVEDAKKSQPIACSNPIDGQIEVTFEFKESHSEIDWEFDSQKSVVHFDEELPPGTKVRFIYACKSLKK